MQQGRNARPWWFFAGSASLGVLDILLPASYVLLPYLVVPIAAAAVIGSVTASLAVTGLSLGLALVSVWVHDYEATLTLQWLSTIALAGGVSVVLAERERRSRQVRANTSARFQAMAENASDVVYLTDAERRITWISPSVTRALGWPPEVMIGRTMADFVQPEDRIATDDVRGRLYAGESVEQPPTGFIVRIQRSGGGHRWMAARLSRVRVDEHGVRGFVGSLTDVDELVRARSEADAERALLRTSLDASFDPKVLVQAVRDEAGVIRELRYLEVNSAMADSLGLPREQIVGRGMHEFAGDRLDASALFAHCVHAIESGQPWTADAFPYGEPPLPRFLDMHARPVGHDRLALTWRDVTERHEAAARLADSEARYRLLAEHSNDVVLLSDGDMRLHWVSPSSLVTLGWHAGELVGHFAHEYLHPDDRESVAAQVAHSEVEGGPIRMRYRWRRPDGTYRWVEALGRPVDDDGYGRRGRIVQLRDIEAQVAGEMELQRRAHRDDLTGVLKRDQALLRLEEIGADALGPGETRALLFIDVDAFKQVNDACGHAAGDAVLVAIAERAKRLVRREDVIARMGGDEFVICLERLHGMADALAIGEKLRRSMHEPVLYEGTPVACTVSIGVAEYRPGEDVDAAIARADRAMYQAKQGGRDRVVVVEADA